MSLLESRELEHPRQASRVVLRLYRYAPEERVAGMEPDRDGFLLTEERRGTSVVVSSLGFFSDEEEARARLRQRTGELAAQGYGPATGPPQRTSLPLGALSASDRA